MPTTLRPTCWMLAALAGAGLGACSSDRGGTTAARDGGGAASAPTLDAAPTTEDSPRPRGITSVASVPRAHWPCRLKGRINGDTPAERTFEYAGPSSCRLPSVLHTEGIVGCPTRYTMTNLELDFSIESVLQYDDRGRLVFRRLGRRGGLKYLWDGDELVADQLVDQEGGDPAPDAWKVVDGKAQHDTFGTPDAIVTVRDGRVQHAMVALLGPTDIVVEWTGPRFAAFEIRPRREGAEPERFVAEYCDLP